MAVQTNQPLQDGYQLQNYRISKVLSSGGFSIVYLADDENDAPVAIKEYLPASLALRREGDALPAISEENLAIFRYGMKCFFEEGKSLSGLSHTNVVRVLNFFRANETAYMVMRYERGRTLQEHIEHHRGSLKEEFIRRIFTLLLNGLREVHTNKLLHLDIKPANIYIRNEGTPLLIDFGAARQTLTDEVTRLNPTYTPGFASPEQYRRRELLGPWSDIYSVGASMFACLAAAAPPAADQRMEKDRHIPASKKWNGKYSRQLLETIDWCLRLDHLERPQSVLALQKVLLRERDPVVSAAPAGMNLRGMMMKLAAWRKRTVN
jgi:serine/threonine protein kinase